MNKWLLTAWLVAPFVVIAGLWFMVDRDAARQNRERMRKLNTDSPLVVPTAPKTGPATNGGANSQSNSERAGELREEVLMAEWSVEQAAAPAAPAKPAAPAAPATGAKPAAAASAAPNMVEPEFLPQGFIIVVEDKPKLASQASPIYLAGNYNGWNPKDAAWVLTPRSDLRWQIIVPGKKSDARLDFKFARGDWEYEELNEDLSTPANRMLPKIDASKLAPGEQPIIELTVPKWGDQRPNRQSRPDLDPYYKLNATGTVKRLQVAGGGVAAMRDVLVWLPAGYDKPENKDKRYPVLYLQDGQNVFMKMPGTPGEWGADEAATRLIASGKIDELIIVAIPHAGASRAREYLPIAAMEGVEPRGQQYAQWLVGEVKPRVDRAFRTKTGAEHTAIGGSSLGAIIALHAATEYPQVFGKVLVESLPLTNAKGAAQQYFAQRTNWPTRVYFGMGGHEFGNDPKNDESNAKLVEASKAFATLLKEKLGAGAASNLKVVIDPAANHDENAWAARLPEALEFLFPPSKGK